MATEIKSTSIKSQNLIAEPVANKPASPEQGQIIQANGTGNIAKGIYQYSGTAWMSLDNAQGDLETLRLIMSTDTDAVGFSSALNSTSTLAGNTNAIPHETSTGTGMLGALEIPSTGGDALLTEFDANKVFRYYSAGANNNNDYFGIPVDIPAQTRGQNIVIKFKYRTEEASADTSDGDFQVSVWDKSNGVKTTSTNTSTVAANAAITVASSTGMAVGDKIWLESGGNAVNNVGNSITQAYVTEVTSSTSIKISEDWTPASTAGSLVVTGWLSDKVSGLLPEADSDTNKVGKDYSIAVKTEEDTEQVVVWFSNKSTTTNVIELFFDGILVSQNKFLQVSNQPKSESYSSKDSTTTNFWDASTASNEFDITMLDPTGGSPPLAQSNLITVTDVSSKTRITAKENIILTVTATGRPNVGDQMILRDQNDMSISQSQTSDGSTAAAYKTVGGSVGLNKNEWLYVYTGAKASRDGGITITAQPQTSDVIILESQDEIFTDWTAWTPTGTWTTNATYEGYWRRVGSNMEIWGKMTMGGAPNSSTLAIDLPPGYAIRQGVGTLFTANSYGDNNFTYGLCWVSDGAGGNVDNNGFVGYESSTSVSLAVTYIDSTAGTYPYTQLDPISQVVPFTWASTDSCVFRASIPIEGWNANFNPVLSMPLVDFDSWENHFVAKIDGSSTTGVIVTNSQSPYGWVDTITRNSTGHYTFTYAGLGLSHAPNVTASGTRVSSHVAVTSVSSTSCQVVAYDPFFDVYRDDDFWVSLTKVASDYIAPVGGATATVIKPAVAILSEQVAGGSTAANAGGTSAAGFNQRRINTANGETWFVSGTFDGVGGTNVNWTLEPGTYEFDMTSPAYSTDYTSQRLYDVTNSAEVPGSCSNTLYLPSGASDYVISKFTHTITSSTEFKIETYVTTGRSTDGLGVYNGNTANNAVFSQVKIRKLK